MEEKQKVAINETMIGIEAPIVVSRLTDNCLYSGFFGQLDSARMKSVTDRILTSIEQTDNQIVVIDLSNVDLIDSAVAAHLLRVGKTISLFGTKVVFCGINANVAQSMVITGVEFEKYTICKDLRYALKKVFEMQGLKIVDLN